MHKSTLNKDRKKQKASIVHDFVCTNKNRLFFCVFGLQNFCIYKELILKIL